MLKSWNVTNLKQKFISIAKKTEEELLEFLITTKFLEKSWL